MSEQQTPTDSVPDVDEPECEPVSEDPEAQKRTQEDAQARVDDVLGAGDEDDFPDDDDDDDGSRAGSTRFATPGGGFAGSEAPILRAVRIGKRNGLTVTSMKRSSGSTGSDHHTSQGRSFAADLSNGSSPTAEMDRVCARLAKLLGHPEFGAGVLNVQAGSLRFQLLYRTDVGGNHFNHVHIGCRAQ